MRIPLLFVKNRKLYKYVGVMKYYGNRKKESLRKANILLS